MIIKRYLAFSIVLLPLVSCCMQQSIDKEKAFFADEKNFFFSADNTFKPLETVAIKINEHKQVMATISKEVKKGTYVVYFEKDKELEVATKQIGKLVPQGPAKAEDFTFRAGNTFSTGETVAVKNNDGVLVVGIITIKQPFTKNRYFVRVVGTEQTPYPASSIGKLKENMGIWEKLKSKVYKSTKPKAIAPKEMPVVEDVAHVVLGFGADDKMPDDKITSAQLEKNYKTQMEEAKNIPDKSARKAREKLIQSSYNALKRALPVSRIYKLSQDLIGAAAEGNIEEVNKALGAGADVNIQADDGSTALMLAIQGGKLAIVRLLLKRKNIDVNVKDVEGHTALMLAVRGDILDIVKLLTDMKNTDINAQDKNGYTALMVGSQKGNLDIVRSFSNLDMVRLLLKRKDIDVNVKDVAGHTALMWAVRGGIVDVVRLLLERKDTDINAQDGEGSTALMLAVQGDNLGFVRSLRALDIVRLLLKRKNIDVNTKDAEGHTALMWAVRKGSIADIVRVDIVRLLIERKDTDINAQDKYGFTALMVVSQDDNLKLVNLLLEREDVDVTIKDETKQSALDLTSNQAIKDVLDKRINKKT